MKYVIDLKGLINKSLNQLSDTKTKLSLYRWLTENMDNTYKVHKIIIT